MRQSEEWIGVTAGNAFARAAVKEDGEVMLVPLEEGESAMPSAVLLHRMREVGKYAQLYSGTDPDLLVSSIGRLLGKRYEEAEAELRRLPIKTVNEAGKIRVMGQLGEKYSPIELYAMVLRRLRASAEKYLNKSVENAVIAVPGSTNDYQRRSIRLAAESVFKGIKLINEPAAAVLALKSKGARANGRVLTFDIGAGKCEVAVVELNAGKVRVKAITGDTHLGGDDLENLLFEHVAKEFLDRHGEPMVGDSQMARHEVLMAIREAKCRLETEDAVEISVPFVNFDHFGRPLHLLHVLTKEQVERLAAPVLARAEELIRICLLDAGTKAVDEVVLMGGVSRMPMIARMVQRLTGKTVQRVERPEELTVRGAAIHAAVMQGQMAGLKVEDVTAHSLGITTYLGEMGFVLKRQVVVPAQTTQTFYTVYPDQQRVHIEVREGEQLRAVENRVIGEFYLTLPPKLPERSPIDVTIGKDENGLVVVRARDHASGSQKEIKINYDL